MSFFSLHALTRSPGVQDVAVIEEAIQDGGGNDVIATEDLSPLVKRFMGGDTDAAS